MVVNRYQQAANKITFMLFLMQSLGSVAFIMMSTVAAIAGMEIGKNASLAGAPSATRQFGGAIAALVVSAFMERIGRRQGISIGIFMGFVGAGLAFIAIELEVFILFLIGSTFVGVAQATMQLGRFVAAEVNLPARRGSAVSNVVIGGTVGAIGGPLLVGPLGRFATSLNMNELAGPYLGGATLFFLTSVMIYIFLYPDPKKIGEDIAIEHPETGPTIGLARSLGELARHPSVQVAVIAMIFGQVAMVLVMGMTSLHMKGHHHSLDNIAVVFSSHTVGMFGVSIFSGRLIDRFGREVIIFVGAIIMIVSCILAPLSLQLGPLSVALFLLGLGWNFCYVGGSTLLADQLSPAERARTQGVNDLMIGLPTATISLISGVIFDNLGYDGVAMTGLVLSLPPLLITGWWFWRKRILEANARTPQVP